MAQDDTVRELGTGRADDAAVLKRTMNIVAAGCDYLAAALRHSELDEAINIARRISNLWVDGHAAYHNIVTSRGGDVPDMSTVRDLLGRYQAAVVALLDEMIRSDISDRLRAAASPLRDRLLSLVLVSSQGCT